MMADSPKKARRSLQSHGQRSKVYVPVLLRIFKRLHRPDLQVIDFSLDDIREALTELGIEGRNPADVIYRMRSRTLLPEAIRAAGFTVLRATNRGKYRFEKAPDTIFALPEPPIAPALDLTPLPVRRLLPEHLADIDEQGLLAVVTYCKLLDHFTGLTVYRLRSHVRKSVRGVGQAEVDEVDVGIALRDDEIPVVIPIEAKAADEPVNRVQIVYQILYAQEYFVGHEVRPVCIKVDYDSVLHFLEFNVTAHAGELKILRSSRYTLTPSQIQLEAIRARAGVALKHVAQKE